MAATKPPAPYNPNKSPKERFVEMSQWVGEHRQMVDSQAFTRGCDMALLQYQRQLSASISHEGLNSGNLAASAGLRMQGAMEFLSILRNISEVPSPAPRRSDDNLTH